MIQSEDGTVVGYAWGVPRDGDALYGAELKQIMILPTVQRQGIGRRLVRYIVARFAEQGVHSLLVEVLRENPNRAFYEHLGALCRPTPP